jgi:hypothetical protein
MVRGRSSLGSEVRVFDFGAVLYADKLTSRLRQAITRDSAARTETASTCASCLAAAPLGLVGRLSALSAYCDPG